MRAGGTLGGEYAVWMVCLCNEGRDGYAARIVGKGEGGSVGSKTLEIAKYSSISCVLSSTSSRPIET